MTRPEPGEPGLRRQQPVGADHHIHGAVGQARQRGRHLGVALEPRQRPDHDRERRITLAERGVVLRRQQGRRHQDRDLLAVLDRLERRPDRDLGLAIADVAADQPVHRDRAFHVPLHLVDGAELIGRLDVREGVLQLALPGRVRAERVPGRGHPGRVQPDQFRGDLPDRLAGAALRLGPVGAAEPVQGRRLPADVPGDLVKLVGGHVQPVRRLAALARRVFDDQVLPGRALHTAAGHLQVAAHPVLLVHDVVARAELERVDAAAAPAGHPPGVPGAGALASQVGLADHRQPHRLPGEPVADQPGRHTWHPGLRRVVEVTEPGAEPFAAQHLREPLRGPVPLGDQHHPPAVGQPAPHIGERPRGIAAVTLRRARADTERLAARLGLVLTAGRRPRRASPGSRTGSPSTRAGPGRLLPPAPR